MTLLSIITPNYNYGRFLRKALASVLDGNQSYQYELIVIDDGSTDDSRAILKSFAHHPNLRIYHHDKNYGIVRALQKGLELARGEYIHFLASDDIYLPGGLDTILGYLQQHSDISFFSSVLAFFDHPELIESQHFLPLDSFHYFNPQQVRTLFRHTDFWIPGHTCFIKKSALLSLPPYDAKLGPACDWLINHTLALKLGVGYLPKCLVAMRQHGQSFSLKQSHSSKRAMWHHLLTLLDQNPQDYQPLVQSGILRMLGLKSIYPTLMRKPQNWRYLFPMTTREIEKKCFQLLGLNREQFWVSRLRL